MLFDVFAAGLDRFASEWGDTLGRHLAWVIACPSLYVCCLVIASSAWPMSRWLEIYTPWDWPRPCAFALSRPLHYAVNFFAGSG
jgi:hypothetical protein